MRVTVISIAVGALVTVPKDLKKRLEELQINWKIKTIHTVVFLKINKNSLKSPV